jgi:hypothetical protein
VGAVVVVTPFVEFRDRGDIERWTGVQLQSEAPTLGEVTNYVEDAKAQRMDLFGEMRIGGLDVTREAYLGAPYRIEVHPDLAERSR